MNENINFEIKSDALAVIQTLNIEANFAEMEAALTEMLEPYKKMVVLDVPAAKSARAYVNKVKKSIDDSRKMVKKLYSQPLAVFEDRCKALTAMCDEAAGNIDEQIKAQEAEEREIKLTALRTYFEHSAEHADVSEFIVWEQVYNPKWENKSYSTGQCEEDIDRAINQTIANVEVIKAMHSPYEAVLLAVLARTGNMGEVLTQKTLCEKLEPEPDAQEPDTIDDIIPEPRAGDRENAPISHERTKEVKLYTFTLEFTTTREKAFLVRDFFEKNNIEYRKVANK